MAGICLIRLRGIRPAFLPAIGGLRSENAAHRIAVEWEENGTKREGVFIPRRDTNGLLNQFAGGRLFPGVHHSAEFHVRESAQNFEVEMRSKDCAHWACVNSSLADKMPASSIFRSLAEASDFFQGGALGWSVREDENSFDGLELSCRQWKMEPLAVKRVESSFFEDAKSFSEGTAEFDSAFLMRDIAHEWHARGRLEKADS